jgi:hypothetical protein
MFNLDLLIKDLKKSFKKGSILFFKDQDYYYLSNAVWALKIKKSILEHEKNRSIKGSLIGLIGSIDNDINLRNGQPANLVNNGNVILNIINKIKEENNFVKSINSKVLIEREDTLLRVYHNETADRLVFINDDYSKLFDSENNLEISLNGSYIKEEIEDNILIVLGFRVEETSLPVILNLKGVK